MRPVEKPICTAQREHLPARRQYVEIIRSLFPAPFFLDAFLAGKEAATLVLFSDTNKLSMMARASYYHPRLQILLLIFHSGYTTAFTTMPRRKNQQLSQKIKNYRDNGVRRIAPFLCLATSIRAIPASGRW
eukprot:scaffold4066_cov152-Skeletonema_menzelii.AAC.14